VRRALVAVALALAVVTALSGCILDLERRTGFELSDDLTDAEFYALPDTIPAGAPGDLIRAKTIQSGPAGARAWRVIYHSTDLAGNDIPVSGIVIVPDLPAPKDGRTVVSWAHPTTGSAQKCGPSLALDPFDLIEGLDNLLAAGYAVVATDYQGMSIAGASSYLLGVTEGNNVLDAVRAGRNLDGAGLGTDVLLWGHSQGGQAALFAAQQARAYAPELQVEAVAVAAPAAVLTTLLSDDIIDVSGVTIASLAIPAMMAAYANTYSQDEMAAILTPAGQVAAPKIAAMCLLADTAAVHAIADPLVGGFVTSDPATTEPWKTILTENSAGGSPLGVPVYIGQGLDDTLVIPTATADYVKGLCAAGERVQFDEFPGITHGLVALTAVPPVLAFFAAVEKGSAPANCIGG
jgi:pimeloyl-ACP methyl ester carboxylesterase